MFKNNYMHLFLIAHESTSRKVLENNFFIVHVGGTQNLIQS